ncbi:MAG: FecR domain-containing protein [Myxococcota bacterium]
MNEANDDPPEGGVQVDLELSDSEARSLRLMTVALRDAEPPDLDWPRLERRLVAAVTGNEVPGGPSRQREAGPERAHGDAPPRADAIAEELPARTAERIGSLGHEPDGASQRRGSHRRWAALALAAGAALAGYKLAPTDAPSRSMVANDHATAPAAAPLSVAPDPASSSDEARPARAPLDVAAQPRVDVLGGPAIAVASLAPGTEVVADATPVRFGLPGTLGWTLARGSAAAIDTVAVPHVIRLHRGRVDVEVVPDRVVKEAFVVVAGATRVAVHGTSFAVVRDEDRVSVDVTRGEVEVASTQAPARPPVMLVGPSRGAFSARSGDRLEGSDAAEVGGPTPTSSVSRPPTRPALTVGEARATMLGCLRGALGRAAADEPRVTIASTVTVVTGASRAITTVRFDPPLRPDLQQTCGGMLLRQRLGEGERTTFQIRLSNR